LVIRSVLLLELQFVEHNSHCGSILRARASHGADCTQQSTAVPVSMQFAVPFNSASTAVPKRPAARTTPPAMNARGGAYSTDEKPRRSIAKRTAP